MPLSATTIRRLKHLVFWLEECVKIPGTKWRIGLDGLLGLLPAIGDTVMLLASLVLIIKAVHQKSNKRVIAVMLKNILIDFIVGLIPVIGDLFDMSWKANKKNLLLLLDQAKATESETEK